MIKAKRRRPGFKSEQTGKAFKPTLTLGAFPDSSQVSHFGSAPFLASTAELITDLTLDAALKAHKYSKVRQRRRQSLCVYRTARSPVGASSARLEHET